MNFQENEEGYKGCPAGHAFDIHVYDSKNDTGEYLQIKQVYVTSKCEGCSRKNNCSKASGNRKLFRNVVLDELQNQVDTILLSEIGKELRKQRGVQAEGVFGVLKEDKQFERFTRRGQENVETEIYLIAIGHNIRKYHAKKNRQLVS